MSGANAAVLTIQDALKGVIGEYTPIAQTTEILGTDNVLYPVTTYVPNWTWFGSLAVFLCALFCFFRAIGGMLKCKV
ncbi:MAG: hypothetical protein RR235_09020 [Oscillospiraceae bacterium]